MRLAMSTHQMLPSALHDRVGASDAKLSRLNTRPAHTPVNASRPTSRSSAHDSGPEWLASPSLYDSFIRYTSPVYPGAPCGITAYGSSGHGFATQLCYPLKSR
jgi:hypothetical protein